MGANRFMSPVKTRYFQTYVSQFVPLPFEIMQRKAAREQKHFDIVKDNWATISSKMGEDVLQEDMNPLMNDVVTGLQSQINQGLEEYGGDWRQMDNMVRNVSNEYKKFTTSGEGALAIQSKKLYDQHSKIVSDSDMAGVDKGLWKQYVRDRYKQEGTALNGAMLQQFDPYNTKDWQEKALKSINQLDPNQRSIAYAGYSDDDRLILKFHEDQKGVDEGRVRNAVKSAIWGDQEFNDMAQKKFQVYSFYDPNIAEAGYANFKESLFNDMVGGGKFDEFAYNQQTKRRSASESALGRELGKQKSQPVPAILTTSLRTRFGKGENYKEIIDSNAPEREFKKLVDNELNQFNDQLRSVFEAQNVGVEYNDFINKTAENYDLDLNESSDQKRFLNGIANGDVDLTLGGTTGFANTDLTKQQIKNMAQNTQREMRNKEGVFLDVAEELVEMGKIDKNDYEAYKDNYNKTWYAQDKLNKIINDPNASVEEVEEAKKDLDNVINYQDQLTKGFGQPTVEAYSTYVKPPVLQTIDTEFAPGFGRTVKAALASKEGRSILKNRAKKKQNQTFNVSGQSQIPITDVTGEYDPYGSKKLFEAYEKELKKKSTHLLQTHVNRKGDVVKLDEALRLDAQQAVENGTYEDVNKAYKELKDQALQGEYQFANTFNPDTGNMMIQIGEYTMDLSTGPANIDFTSAKNMLAPSARQDMAVNSYIQKAMSDFRINTEVEKGIFIYTPEPGAVDKIDSNYKQQFKDGQTYAIRIDANLLGIGEEGRRGDYRYIPQTRAKEFLGELQKINDIARQNGGYYITPDGEQISKEEEIENLAKDYTSLTK